MMLVLPMMCISLFPAAALAGSPPSTRDCTAVIDTVPRSAADPTNLGWRLDVRERRS
jgi:hypothetical protein